MADGVLKDQMPKQVDNNQKGKNERNYNELKSKAKMRGCDDIIEQCDEAIEQCHYYKENAQNKKENMNEIFEFDD